MVKRVSKSRIIWSKGLFFMYFKCGLLFSLNLSSPTCVCCFVSRICLESSFILLSYVLFSEQWKELGAGKPRGEGPSSQRDWCGHPETSHSAAGPRFTRR